jgi:hypothetical protein
VVILQYSSQTIYKRPHSDLVPGFTAFSKKHWNPSTPVGPQPATLTLSSSLLNLRSCLWTRAGAGDRRWGFCHRLLVVVVAVHLGFGLLPRLVDAQIVTQTTAYYLLGSGAGFSAAHGERKHG